MGEGEGTTRRQEAAEAPSAAVALPLPPRQGAEREELGFSGAQVVGVWARSAGEGGRRRKEGPRTPARGQKVVGGGAGTSTHTLPS